MPLTQHTQGDGCTFFPDGDWVSCCDAHDAAYGAGYNKWKADLDLLRCALRSGHPIAGFIMYVGVTVGGWYRYWKANR